MKRTLTIALALLASTGAWADWQYTRWGMSLDEVRAASGGTATMMGTPLTQKDGSRTLLESPFLGSGVRFKVRFTFDGKTGGLSYVIMDPDEPKECDQVMRALITNYGRPVQFRKDNDYATSMAWIRPGAKDLVRYVAWAFQEPTCSVHFFPVTEGPLEERGPEL